MAFPGNEILQQDQLLVLLKDHGWLPVMYGGAGGPSNQPGDFTRLRHDFRLFLHGRRQLTNPDYREGVIPVPNMVIDQMAWQPVPPILRPFFAGQGQPEPEALPYVELWERFLYTYVARYPAEDVNRMEHYFARNAERCPKGPSRSDLLAAGGASLSGGRHAGTSYFWNPSR